MERVALRRWNIVSALMIVSLVAAFVAFAAGADAAAPAWNGNSQSYAVGAVVSYGGSEYRCLQAHTSQPAWTPPATPALWQLVTGPTATSTRTPTPGGPTATATRTPTRTPTPSGVCTAPAWNASTAYTGGSVVSYNGRTWRAKWWTQNEVPGVASSGVWEDLGPCSTNPTPTSTRTPTPSSTPTGPTVTPTPGGKRMIGYFVEWGVYARNYHVKNIKTSGSAAKLTHINYAFANVVSSRCQLGDTYADYDRFYDAATSVDGVADTWDAGALRGNFNQLRKLKAEYPQIKVLISLGGWSWSGGFSDAALPANRVAFVKSCIDLYIKDPRWTGVFDGIDIDWEYPGACGLTCNFRPEDTQNFTALLAEFRSQLNAVRPGLLLTIAAPAGQDKIAKIQVGSIHQYLDFINLMTYDFHGTWENTTNFNSPLYPATGDPAAGQKLTTDEAVTTWLQGGTPPNKLVVGVPFYGKGWQGVGSANNGLWQASGGAAPGTYEPGSEDYKVLKTKGYPRFFQSQAQAAWLYSGGIFWTYDDPPVMTAKMNYIKSKGLGGVMFWELSGDTSNGELITTLYNNR